MTSHSVSISRHGFVFACHRQADIGMTDAPTVKNQDKKSDADTSSDLSKILADLVKKNEAGTTEGMLRLIANLPKDQPMLVETKEPVVYFSILSFIKTATVFGFTLDTETTDIKVSAFTSSNTTEDVSAFTTSNTIEDVMASAKAGRQLTYERWTMGQLKTISTCVDKIAKGHVVNMSVPCS
jgi:hypothetical protein